MTRLHNPVKIAFGSETRGAPIEPEAWEYMTASAGHLAGCLFSYYYRKDWFGI